MVVGAVDPNPSHAGRGLERLRSAGIEVISGVLAEEAAALNAAFNKWIVTGLPLVIAKCARSLDGRITRPPGEGQWLTSEAARADAHKLRGQVDAILIGAGTLLEDNPRLTVRGVRNARQPWRVVLAGTRPLPDAAHVFTDEFHDRTLVYKKRTLPWVLRDLGKRGVTSVLIEGGARVLGEAFRRELVDRVHFYVAPLLTGGPKFAIAGNKRSIAIENPRYRRVGPDLLMTGSVSYGITGEGSRAKPRKREGAERKRR